MTLLTKNDILQASDLATEDVAVPAWGGSVRVRAMTGFDRDAFSESLSKDEEGNVDVSNYRAKLLSKCIVDDAGNLVFTDADVAALGAKSAAAIAAVFAVAERLNGSGAVAEIKKNSPVDPSGSSTSASPSL